MLNEKLIPVAAPVTTWVHCWKITRKDGHILGFTDSVYPITVDAVYYDPKTGMTTSSLECRANLSGSASLQGLLKSDAITEQDLRLGKYDLATVDILMMKLDAQHQPAQVFSLKRGIISHVLISEGSFVAEIRDLVALTKQHIGSCYTSQCRACLGDDRCGVDLNAYTVEGSIESILNGYTVQDTRRQEEAGYFNQGVFTLTSGENEGFSVEVRQFIDQTIILFTSAPYPLQTGDQYRMTAGCDKLLETCVKKFNNIVNFRGEPHIPSYLNIYNAPKDESF